MLKKLMQTDDELAGLVVRVALGLVMFPHGAQKVLGWFGAWAFPARWRCSATWERQRRWRF